MRNQGFPDDVFDGRPVIGIANSFSEFTPCNAHFRELAERVKLGVWEAGGFPLEFPTMSLGESTIRPTAMLYRNLMAMDTEESIRGYPMDGVVLLCGCDKTTPGPIMGAASVGLPTLVVSGGAMLNGKYKGKDVGSGTSVWEFSEKVRAGEMTEQEFTDAEACMSRSRGTCMTMGTASTMACMAESLGLTLPGCASIPAADSRRNRIAHMSGRRIVDMVKENLTIDKVLTRNAFLNAIRTNAAIGGSTNAVVHLLAIAGRLGVKLSLEDFDAFGSRIPLLVNLMPSGKYLMEDLFYAGGLPVVLRELQEAGQLFEDALTVNGKPIGENNSTAECYNRDVIYPYSKPLQEAAGIAVLRGNLAPNGAIIKPSAATPSLLQHTGKAIVFENIEDLRSRVDSKDLDVDKSTVMVLKGCGPKGYPGFPEVGNMPLPKKLLQEGVRDVVRISDARMSGTAYGTVVLHAAPEAAAGGPLAVVKTGDVITLDVAGRKLQLQVSEEELKARLAAWTPPAPVATRGYSQLYINHVTQADVGADFDFLAGSSGAFVPRHSH